MGHANRAYGWAVDAGPGRMGMTASGSVGPIRPWGGPVPASPGGHPLSHGSTMP